MKPYGPEGTKRINRHREQRAKDHYTTLEKYGSLAGLKFSHSDLVLLEDISNYLANLIFALGLDPVAAIEQAEQELSDLGKTGAELILVSLSCNVDQEYDTETNSFILALTELNRRLSALAKEVVLVNDNVAHMLKKEQL